MTQSLERRSPPGRKFLKACQLISVCLQPDTVQSVGSPLGLAVAASCCSPKYGTVLSQPEVAGCRSLLVAVVLYRTTVVLAVLLVLVILRT